MRTRITPLSYAFSFAFHLAIAAAVALFAAPTPKLAQEAQIVFFKASDSDAAGTPRSGPEMSKPVKRNGLRRRPSALSDPALDPAKDVSPSAGAEVAAATKSSTGSTPAGQAEGIELMAQERYAAELRQLLEQRKAYPGAARRLGQKGRVVARFVLARDGRILKSEMIETTEHESLNQAARALIETLDGFKPFPDGIARETWEFIVPIDYAL